MWKYCGVYYVLCIIVTVAYGHDFRSFDDSILFKINWPGKANSDLLVSINEVKLKFVIYYTFVFLIGT